MDVPTKKRRTQTEWNAPASFMAKNTDNPIRKIVDTMKITPNPNKEMIALSIGDPTVFGNFNPTDVAHEAVIEAMKTNKSNGYAPSVGYESSRQAVADYYTCPEAPITAKDIVFASGCSGALDLCISVLAQAGQNILVPCPGFSLYKTLANSLGIEVRNYDLQPDRSWEIDLDHMASIMDDQTAAVVINNPSNPCGSVYSRAHIRDILEVCDKNKVPIISDEVYADFVFPGNESVRMATETTQVPIVACGGLTKRWVVPGWRMGWIIIHDRNGVFEKEVRQGLTALSQRILGPNTLIQGAVARILKDTPQEYYTKTITNVKKAADTAYKSLSSIPGLKPVMPQGAMYMMVGIDMSCFPGFQSDVDFTEKLVVEQSVFALPASCFQYPNYFRVVLTVPLEKIEEACARITEFCQEHYTSAGDRNQSNGHSNGVH